VKIEREVRGPLTVVASIASCRSQISASSVSAGARAMRTRAIQDHLEPYARRDDDADVLE
jgi:hypothetical protein